MNIFGAKELHTLCIHTTLALPYELQTYYLHVQVESKPWNLHQYMPQLELAKHLMVSKSSCTTFRGNEGAFASA